jgi:hypothetical protein
MMRLPLPEFAEGSIYSQCVENVIPLSKRQRFQAATAAIKAVEDGYRRCVESADIANVPEVLTVAAANGEVVTGDEISALYDNGMLRKKGPARSAYDALRIQAPGGICPYCGQLPVATLDHYLPRSRRKALAVAAFNLIPACRDCNAEKLEYMPDSNEEAVLHPYHDRCDEVRWLFARFDYRSPLAVRFIVEAPEGWDLGARVFKHFEVFKLSRLYSTQAAVELVSTREILVRRATAGGDDALVAHLSEQYDSYRAVAVNSWRTALYQEMLNDPMFRLAGIPLIPKSLGIPCAAP